MLESVEDEFTQFTRFGFSLLTNLPAYYEEADLDTKRKMTGLIFPGKLIFDGNNKCRTTSVNPAIVLFCPKIAENAGNKKGHDSKNAVMPTKACPGGFEPPTF